MVKEKHEAEESAPPPPPKLDRVKTECLLNAQLPNTHACPSRAQEFCLNPLLWVVN